MKIFLFLILSLTILNLHAQPGTLDSTFGSTGIVLEPSTLGVSNANAVQQQQDGIIVTAGCVEIGPAYDIFVSRYLLDGTPDTSF